MRYPTHFRSRWRRAMTDWLRFLLFTIGIGFAVLIVIFTAATVGGF